MVTAFFPMAEKVEVTPRRLSYSGGGENPVGKRRTPSNAVVGGKKLESTSVNRNPSEKKKITGKFPIKYSLSIICVLHKSWNSRILFQKRVFKLRLGPTCVLHHHFQFVLRNGYFKKPHTFPLSKQSIRFQMNL